MDLSKYDEIGENAPQELLAKYHLLRQRLHQLNDAPVKDMAAIDAVIVELDEVQAGVKHANKMGSDSQRF